MPYDLVTVSHGGFVERFATLPEAVAALDREKQRIEPCAGSRPLTVDQVCEIRGIDMKKARSALLAGMTRRYRTVQRNFPGVAFVHQRAVELHLDLTQDAEQYSSPELTEYYVQWWTAQQPTPYGAVRTVDPTPDRRKTSAAQPRSTTPQHQTKEQTTWKVVIAWFAHAALAFLPAQSQAWRASRRF